MSCNADVTVNQRSLVSALNLDHLILLIEEADASGERAKSLDGLSNQ
jgi:hypothetical protein